MVSSAFFRADTAELALFLIEFSKDDVCVDLGGTGLFGAVVVAAGIVLYVGPKPAPTGSMFSAIATQSGYLLVWLVYA